MAKRYAGKRHFETRTVAGEPVRFYRMSMAVVLEITSVVEGIAEVVGSFMAINKINIQRLDQRTTKDDDGFNIHEVNTQLDVAAFDKMLEHYKITSGKALKLLNENKATIYLVLKDSMQESLQESMDELFSDVDLSTLKEMFLGVWEANKESLIPLAKLLPLAAGKANEDDSKAETESQTETKSSTEQSSP